MNLKKIVCAALSTAVILLSPGLGGWQALAADMNAESGGAERLSAENLGVSQGGALEGPNDLKQGELQADISNPVGDLALPAPAASDRDFRDLDASDQAAELDPKNFDADSYRAASGARPRTVVKPKKSKAKAAKSKALDQARSWRDAGGRDGGPRRGPRRRRPRRESRDRRRLGRRELRGRPRDRQG